jgi:hypothetical protein
MGQAISPFQTCQNDWKRAKTNAKMQERKTIGTGWNKEAAEGRADVKHMESILGHS